MNQKQFKPNNSAELRFARQLRKVARQAAHIVETHSHGDKIFAEREMLRRLEEYSKALGPWARRQSAKMIERVSNKNKAAWKTSQTKNSRLMATLLKQNVGQREIGYLTSKLIEEQVDLIKSIPLRAGLRAQGLAQKAFYEGTRAHEIAKELAATEEVSEADAERIARTEVARANSVITEARAVAVGSKQYIWRTSGDAAVRPSHKAMNGEVISWDKPPTLDDGTTGHAGTFPNCRCYPEPFFPD